MLKLQDSTLNSKSQQPLTFSTILIFRQSHPSITKLSSFAFQSSNPFNKWFHNLTTWRNYTTFPYDLCSFYNPIIFFPKLTLFISITVWKTHSFWSKHSLLLFLRITDRVVSILWLFDIEVLLEFFDIRDKHINKKNEVNTEKEGSKENDYFWRRW